MNNSYKYKIKEYYSFDYKYYENGESDDLLHHFELHQ